MRFLKPSGCRAALMDSWQQSYWNTFTSQQCETYPNTKRTLMSMLAYSETAAYSNTLLKWSECIQQAINASTTHVDPYLAALHLKIIDFSG